MPDVSKEPRHQTTIRERMLEDALRDFYRAACDVSEKFHVAQPFLALALKHRIVINDVCQEHPDA